MAEKFILLIWLFTLIHFKSLVRSTIGIHEKGNELIDGCSVILILKTQCRSTILAGQNDKKSNKRVTQQSGMRKKRIKISISDSKPLPTGQVWVSQLITLVCCFNKFIS